MESAHPAKESTGAYSQQQTQSQVQPAKSSFSPKGESAKGAAHAGSYYNPLYVRAKKIKYSGALGTKSIREEARTMQCKARCQLLKVKNRARGDTAVNGMIYASRRLINITRRILKKEVTPKEVYEFRFAKAEFEKAKQMHIAGASKLPRIYREGDLKRIRKREEEEDAVIPKTIFDDLEP